jgi:hypothetical protein
VVSQAGWTHAQKAVPLIYAFAAVQTRRRAALIGVYLADIAGEARRTGASEHPRWDVVGRARIRASATIDTRRRQAFIFICKAKKKHVHDLAVETLRPVPVRRADAQVFVILDVCRRGQNRNAPARTGARNHPHGIALRGGFAMELAVVGVDADGAIRARI